MHRGSLLTLFAATALYVPAALAARPLTDTGDGVQVKMEVYRCYDRC